MQCTDLMTPSFRATPSETEGFSVLGWPSVCECAALVVLQSVICVVRVRDLS